MRSGRTVVAAVRSADKAAEVFTSLGLEEGRQSEGRGILITQAGVDVTNEETLTEELFRGVTQVGNRGEVMTQVGPGNRGEVMAQRPRCNWV